MSAADPFSLSRFVAAQRDTQAVALAELRAATEAMLAHRGQSAIEILGWPDDFKFHASMTLFARATDDPTLFAGALEAYFSGLPHQPTVDLLLERQPSS